MDITHDPKSGCDSYALAEVFRAGRDPRIKYIISNRKICSSEVDPWQWRDYHGVNPHDHHVHVSVLDIKAKYDDTTPWNLDAKPMPAPAAIVPVSPPTLRVGDNGDSVKELQRLARDEKHIHQDRRRIRRQHRSRRETVSVIARPRCRRHLRGRRPGEHWRDRSAT
jgi:hypothetical protein